VRRRKESNDLPYMDGYYNVSREVIKAGALTAWLLTVLASDEEKRRPFCRRNATTSLA